MKAFKKKQLLCLFIASLTFLSIRAQKGNNNLSLNVETSIPFFQNDYGVGFYVKGSYGMGTSGQVSLSAGISKFNLKNSVESPKVTTRVVPFLLSYKQYFGKLFIEPKFGFGELGGTLSMDGDYARPSVAAIFGGLSAGFYLNKFNVGINFLTTHGIENASAGLWNDKNFHYTSVFVGYNIF